MMTNMNKIKTIICATVAAFSLTACNDYLDIMPENSLPTENMWKSKSDVESALYSGYYNLRQSITTHLIPLGELRAGCTRRRSPNNLDKLEIKPTDGTYTDWKIFYKIIADANGVIANAGKAKANDATYTEQEMNSHLCEAYWLRALSYFYLVRNWRDAPLLLEPYETDGAEYYVAQSPEADIIAQIKADLLKAVSLGAAKEQFDTTWETKGRATVWAIYALLADVCLWNQDFDDAIKYADMILESKSPYAPRFITTASHSGWFQIFNPGNSEESIFELQYSASKQQGTGFQTNNLPTLFYNNVTTTYMLSDNLTREMNRDASDIYTRFNGDEDMYGRTKFGCYWAQENSNTGYVWKYLGGSTISEPRTSNYYDPNFIIYRVTEMKLIKAEALVMRAMGTNTADNEEAIRLVNEIRTRTNLLETAANASSDFSTLLGAVMDEKIKEFIAEGKTWYDLLRIGRYTDPTGGVNFTSEFFIPYVINYNETAGENKIKATLLDKNAWYLPVNETEITRNPQLKQNPYYE